MTRIILGAFAVLGLAGGANAAPKYYFNIAGVKAAEQVDESTRASAREALEKELATRAEVTTDLAGAKGQAAVVAELKRRSLQGYDVTVQIERLEREVKPPRPGARLKQLAVKLKLSIFGTTVPGAKLAFGGDGEAAVEAEVVERRMDEEGAALINEVMATAVRQAVDQAILKLGLPRSQPIDESKRKRKKRTAA